MHVPWCKKKERKKKDLSYRYDDYDDAGDCLSDWVQVAPKEWKRTDGKGRETGLRAALHQKDGRDVFVNVR